MQADKNKWLASTLHPGKWAWVCFGENESRMTGFDRNL